MTHRHLSGKQSLLRIFIGDLDTYHHKSLYRVILEDARSQGLAGCTIIRGAAGFGRTGRMYTGIEMEGAGNMPLIVEIVDEPSRILSFWNNIKPKLADAVVTDEAVYVHRHQVKQKTETNFSPDLEDKSMDVRQLNGEHVLLRIFLGESDKIDHDPLHFRLLQTARKMGLAGCTSVRGIAGFGASSVIHTAHLFRLSSDLPIIVEVVDEERRIHDFLEKIRPMLQGALVTEEKVKVRHYGHKVSSDKAH